MSEEIDWSKPIRASSILGDRRLGWDYRAVRREQIRRAELLIRATGSKQKATANRIGALAEIVPGLRWTAGRLTYRGLAPDMVDLMSSIIESNGPGHRKPGRPVTWPADRLAALLERVEQIKSESSKRLTDDHALARIRKESKSFWKQRAEAAEAAGLPFDKEAQRRATMPEIETLRNHLARARAARP